MPLSDMLDLIGLRKLFQKAEGGDQEAARVVRNLNKDPQLTGAAFASPAKMDTPGLAQLPEELKVSSRPMGDLVSSGQPTRNFDLSGGTGLGVETPQDKHGKLKTAWTIFEAAARGAQDPRFRAQDGPGYLGRKFQQEQLDALGRRHQMWDSTYKASQELPPEVLSDPKFASLAQAKAALDKDMQDGKVDNEKNVSAFLTEMMRFKTELKQAQQDTALNQQLDLEGRLQKGREERGLAEPMEKKEYMFDGTPVTRTEFLRLSDIKRRDELDDSRMRETARLAAQARTDAERWRKEDRAEALSFREQGRTVQNLNALVESNIKQNQQVDEMTGRPLPPTERDMVRAIMQNKDALLEGARRVGVDVQQPDYVSNTPGVWKINGKPFKPEEQATMLMYLYQLINAR